MCLIKQTQVSEPFVVAGSELVKISHLWEKKNPKPVIFHQLLLLEGASIPCLLSPHCHAELDSNVSHLTLGVLSYTALAPKVSPPLDQAQLSRPPLSVSLTLAFPGDNPTAKFVFTHLVLCLLSLHLL